MKLGFIGLGKMGKNMVLNLLDHKIEVVAFNRSPGPLDEVEKAGAAGAESLESLISSLRGASGGPSKRDKQSKNDGVVIWLMLPAGEVTDEHIDKLLPLLSKNDLIIDGANSYYKDTLRRSGKLKEKGIHFMDIGVSGGPKGARTGACLMIGGSQEDFERIKSVVIAASAPNAWGYFGPVGSGHFAKMVHNGIEYGMMEAIGEGAAILKYGPFKLDLKDVFRVYNNKSVIESRLVGWTEEALAEDPELKETSSEIKASGEGEWTIRVAEELGIDVPVIKNSLKVRQNSANDNEQALSFRNKVVSAQRGKFGQHDVKRNTP